MASHGVTRTVRTRTEEQKQQDLDKIKKYRDLEEEVRVNIAKNNFTLEVFQLTSKLLRLNPEYYTIWNVRRRLLISGLLSRPSAGSSPSTASPTSSRNDTTTPSSAAYSSSSSTTTRPVPSSQTAGKNGTTADATGGFPAEARATGGSDDAPQSNQDAEKDLAVLRSELEFTIPLLMSFPKCYWIWGYRLWVLQKAIERLAVPVARRIWEEELGLVSKMVTKDRRNFHAWGYRRQVVAQLESPELDGSSMVEAEFEYTTRMIRADLSNFSAWHNRSKLIPRLLDERKANDLARKGFFDAELNLIRDALNVGPDDQSLWYYHQFLMLDLVEYAARPTVTPRFTLEERVTYLTRELEDMKDLLIDYDDCKLIYENLIDYTLALCQLEERAPDEQEKRCLTEWLESLRKLDPMREGRWNDLEKTIKLQRSGRSSLDIR
ncbi:Geranylgeranyl transferase type-2 subunit alpha [Pleurostoma richardsiae]|uniref:Geranylgeranyl transferase type-2 subunit alpha n=1 Tax=Pleurostoma richardsiae TaxID=41990 RepID=A0AA38RKF3_9PEZI|nr:Geranylgeranyl transferase type-2 subunit alpha [Pleurostoma richardsiae]